jgi:uncharacterized coiled-coil protein SlyX
MFNETPAENVSVESQHPVLATLNSKIAELESTIERQKGTITNYSNIVDSKQRLLDAVERFIKEKVEEGDIELELAKEIADILGIDLNKTFEIELTFKATVSVSVPIDFTGDIDDVAQDFYANLRYGGVGDVDSEDIELEDWRDNS